MYMINSNNGMLYRWHLQHFNDGTTGLRLQYLSHCNLWQGTMERYQRTYAREKLELCIDQLETIAYLKSVGAQTEVNF